MALVKISRGADIQHNYVNGVSRVSILEGAYKDATVERIALQEAIRQLPEKERMTILLRYFKGLTQEQTARVVGVSQVQISRLEKKGLARLREIFGP